MKKSSRLPAAAMCACLALAPHICAGDAESGCFRSGLRCAAGIGGFHGHVPLRSPDFGGYAIAPQPSFSADAGFAASFRLNAVMSIALEPQYAYYGADGKFSLREPETGEKKRHRAGVSLHSAELPALARFDISPAYMESGLYIGGNIHAPARKNDKKDDQQFNGFACGAALGLGMEFKRGLALGLRWQYSLREYVEDSNGYPWAFRVGLTKYFLN